MDIYTLSFLVILLYVMNFIYSLQPGAKIVYVDGAFDVLHPGHLGFLRAARALG